MTRVRIDIPATCSNFDPGLGTLALALGLFNTVEIAEIGYGLDVTIDGFGANDLPTSTRNRVVRAAGEVFTKAGLAPSGLEMRLTNNIPIAAGLGSSATAVLGGLVGSNELLGGPLSRNELLSIAYDLDQNAAALLAALHGNLVIVAHNPREVVHHKVQIAPMEVCVVCPLSIRPEPVALPVSISLSDAHEQVGRTALLVQALMAGDFDLLQESMRDTMSRTRDATQSPDCHAAIEAAMEAGASAVFISGAGRSIFAFAPRNHAAILAAMAESFKRDADAEIAVWTLPVETHGISVSETGISFGGARSQPVSAGGRSLLDADETDKGQP